METLDKLQYATGMAASAGISTPTLTYGNFLNDNGLWLLSFAEWMKVVGAIYVAILILKMIIKFIVMAKGTLDERYQRSRKRSDKAPITRRTDILL